MPKTQFYKGLVLSPEVLSKMNNPTVDGQQLDGHGPKVTDLMLDDSVNSLKSRFNQFYENLQVVYSSGLNFIVKSGGCQTDLGEVIIFPTDTVITCPNNAVSYISVSRVGVLDVSSSFPTSGYHLAKVVTASGSMVGSIVDLRRSILPQISQKPNSPILQVLKATSLQRQTTRDVTLTWQTIVEDSHLGFSNNLYTVPLDMGGLYQISGSIYIKNYSPENFFRLNLWINNIACDRIAEFRLPQSIGGYFNFGPVLRRLNENDVIKIVADNYGSNADYEIGSGSETLEEKLNRWEMIRISY